MSPLLKRVLLASTITAEDGPHQPGESIVVDAGLAERLHAWGMLAGPPEDEPEVDDPPPPPPPPPQAPPEAADLPQAAPKKAKATVRKG